MHNKNRFILTFVVVPQGTYPLKVSIDPSQHDKYVTVFEKDIKFVTTCSENAKDRIRNAYRNDYSAVYSNENESNKVQFTIINPYKDDEDKVSEMLASNHRYEITISNPSELITGKEPQPIIKVLEKKVIDKFIHGNWSGTKVNDKEVDGGWWRLRYGKKNKNFSVKGFRPWLNIKPQSSFTMRLGIADESGMEGEGRTVKMVLQ